MLRCMLPPSTYDDGTELFGTPDECDCGDTDTHEQDCDLWEPPEYDPDPDEPDVDHGAHLDYVA